MGSLGGKVVSENRNESSMTDRNHEEGTKEEIKTNGGYGIVAGWLILPGMGILLSFISTISTILTSNPSHSITIELYYFSYILSILYVPFYLVIITSWIKRKSFLPKLMVAYYSASTLFPILIYF
jgi:hypothetical protein